MPVQSPETPEPTMAPEPTMSAPLPEPTTPTELTTLTKTGRHCYGRWPRSSELSRIRPPAGSRQGRRPEPGGRRCWRPGAFHELK